MSRCTSRTSSRRPPLRAGLPIGPWRSTFSASATGVMMGMREYSYSAAILSLAMALDDKGASANFAPAGRSGSARRALSVARAPPCASPLCSLTDAPHGS